MTRPRKNAKTLFYIILIITGLMLTSQIKSDENADIELDPTLVGVKDGDVFEFKIETLKSEIDGVPQNISLLKGDIISIHVDNATVIVREGNSCWIWFDIKINGELDERELDGMEITTAGIRYILLPDWEVQKIYLDDAKESLFTMANAMQDNNLSLDWSFEILDKLDTFISILRYTGPGTSSYDSNFYDTLEERVYDKHSGVLLYYYSIGEIQYRNHGDLTVYETINTEYELKRKGYTLDNELTKAKGNDNANLDYPFLISVPVVFITLIYGKKKYKI